MWSKGNNILKQTNCIAYHPYYGKAQVLLTEGNEPLFAFNNIAGKQGNKHIILDAVPSFEISAKIPSKSNYIKLAQYGVDEFANTDEGFYLIGGRLRADGIYNTPYNTKFDDVRIGTQYWDGIINIDWWDTDGTTQTYTLNESNGDTTASVKVINESFGYWEQKDESAQFFGVYIGKGAYDGEYRTIGTPMWQSEDEALTITTFYDAEQDEQVPKGLTLDEERDMYIIGSYGSSSGWHEIPKGVFVFGDTITAVGCANEPEEGEEAPTPPANINLAWKGFTDGNKTLSRVWVADTPTWR